MMVMFVGTVLVIVTVAYVLFPLFKAERMAGEWPRSPNAGGECPHCRSLTEPDALFCSRCGRPLRLSPTEPADSQP
jgi:predicted amidophosphoribosyltransferase